MGGPFPEKVEIALMRSFSFYIEDDRYSVPTLEFVTVRSIEQARELATARLSLSPHLRRIKVCDAEDQVFDVSRDDG